MLPLSYVPEAGVQYGALARLNVQPAFEGLLDIDFKYAPPGVAPIDGVSVIRPLVSGLFASSVECNAVAVDADRLTCAGLVRVGDGPMDLDLLLARVRIIEPATGFEEDEADP